MMSWMLVGAATVVVSIVVLAALIGWGARVTRYQRIGLMVMAAGLIWAAPARLFGAGPGIPDLMFLGGLALYLCARHGPHIMVRVDRLDGVEDGQVKWPIRR